MFTHLSHVTTTDMSHVTTTDAADTTDKHMDDDIPHIILFPRRVLAMVGAGVRGAAAAGAFHDAQTLSGNSSTRASEDARTRQVDARQGHHSALADTHDV